MTEGTGKETSKGGGPLPVVAALLIIVLVGQVVFMFMKFKSGPAATPSGGTVSTPRAVPGTASSRGPSPSQPGVATMPGASTAPAGAGVPAVVNTPYIGPVATVDTSTWLLVPGDFLLGALLRVDGNADTRLKPDQQKKALELLAEVAAPSQAAAEAMDKLVALVPKVLEPEQLNALPTSPDALRSTNIDVDALVGKLKTIAGSTSAAPPQVTQDAANTLSPTFVLALLDKLADTKKLKPEQAAKLLPGMTEMLEKLKVQASFYPRVLSFLDKPQQEYFVRVLNDMRSGKLDAATVKVTRLQAEAYFKARAAQ